MLKVTFDMSSVDRWASTVFPEQVAYAQAVGLTKTAQKVKAAQSQEMRNVFDRPTRFTLNSVFMRPATKQRKYSEVWLKDTGDAAAAEYLKPQITGGKRPIKRFERRLQEANVLKAGWVAVPGKGARLNAHGNMSPAQLVTLMSVLRAHLDSNQNTTDRSRNRAAKAGKSRDYFVSGPNHAAKAPNGGRLPFGVYQRVGRRIQSILFFAPSASYKKRYDFIKTAMDVVDRNIRNDFIDALHNAMGSRR